MTKSGNRSSKAVAFLFQHVKASALLQDNRLLASRNEAPVAPRAARMALPRGRMPHASVVFMAAVVAIFSLVPLGFIGWITYDVGWETVRTLVFRPRVGELLVNTVLLESITVPLSIVLAVTLAWLGHATVLINFYGLRILTEQMTQVRSISIGVWLTRGSRHESADQSGIAHFVEHMLFKGTDTRSAEDIAQAIDSIAGQLDAFTAKEYASYYIKVLDEHLPLAVDILADIVLNPAFKPEDIEREKKVVIQANELGQLGSVSIIL